MSPLHRPSRVPQSPPHTCPARLPGNTCSAGRRFQRRGSRPASTWWQPRSAISATSRCARWRRWPRPMSSPARTRGSRASCSTATASRRRSRPITTTTPQRCGRRSWPGSRPAKRSRSCPMPAPRSISDPGYKLVREAREAGHAVTTAPGSSAVHGGARVAGLPTDRFFFEGFLPAKEAARRSRIAELAAHSGNARAVRDRAAARGVACRPRGRARGARGGGLPRAHQAVRGGPARRPCDARRRLRRDG